MFTLQALLQLPRGIHAGLAAQTESSHAGARGHLGAAQHFDVAQPARGFTPLRMQVAEPLFLGGRANGPMECERLRHRQNGGEVHRTHVHARTDAQSLREKVRPQAESMMQTTAEGYRAGRFSLLELADAQIQLIELEREAIRAAAQFHTLTIDIKRVTGEPIIALSTRSTP